MGNNNLASTKLAFEGALQGGIYNQKIQYRAIGILVKQARRCFGITTEVVGLARHDDVDHVNFFCGRNYDKN